LKAIGVIKLVVIEMKVLEAKLQHKKFITNPARIINIIKVSLSKIEYVLGRTKRLILEDDCII
jgi:hypothetical protein